MNDGVTTSPHTGGAALFP